MAKKSKRSVSAGSGSPAQSSAPALSNAPATYARPASASTGFASSRPTYSTEFKPDYSLVVSDLKKIGSLAAVFTVILVALSFFLR
jgi:hypothetical protein